MNNYMNELIIGMLPLDLDQWKDGPGGHLAAVRYSAAWPCHEVEGRQGQKLSTVISCADVNGRCQWKICCGDRYDHGRQSRGLRLGH